MATLLNADTVVGGAIITGDASGVLALQAAGNTGLTLNSSRAIGVGASPSFGSSGQVLTSGGSGAAPTWATPSSGAMVLLSTITASASATVDVETGFGATYDSYIILGTGLVPSSTSAVRPRCRSGRSKWRKSKPVFRIRSNHAAAAALLKAELAALAAPAS